MKESWNGYMVNTVYAKDVQYIICKREKTFRKQHEYFKVKPKRSAVTATLCDVINILLSQE